MVGDAPWCFCGTPARNSVSSKDKKVFYFCGTTVDYGELSKAEKIRDVREREKRMSQINLGCNLKLSEEDFMAVYKAFDYRIPKMVRFPECYHNLYAKLCVSHSRENMNRPFFACAVPLPNASCGYFKWCSDFMDLDKEPQEVQSPFLPPPSSLAIKEDDVPKTQQSPWNKN